MASFDCPAVYMHVNSDEGTQTLHSQTGTGNYQIVFSTSCVLKSLKLCVSQLFVLFYINYKTKYEKRGKHIEHYRSYSTSSKYHLNNE